MKAKLKADKKHLARAGKAVSEAVLKFAFLGTLLVTVEVETVTLWTAPSQSGTRAINHFGALSESPTGTRYCS